MKKSNQIQSVDASASAVPERVSVAMGEIAENMQEGLLALAVGAGLQVMQALMDADVTELAGPKGRHDEARTAVPESYASAEDLIGHLIERGDDRERIEHLVVDERTHGVPIAL